MWWTEVSTVCFVLSLAVTIWAFQHQRRQTGVTALIITSIIPFVSISNLPYTAIPASLQPIALILAALLPILVVGICIRIFGRDLARRQ